MEGKRAEKNEDFAAKELLAVAKEVASTLFVGRELAEEIAQKAVVAIVKAKSDIVDLRAYVRTAVQRIGYAELRKRRLTTLAEDGLAAADDPAKDPSFRIETLELTNKIKSLLSPDDLLLITERFIDGRSCRELARSRNVPESTLRVHISDLLKELRSKLE